MRSTTTHRPVPREYMTYDQAKRIERAADAFGMDVEDFVLKIVRQLGDRQEVYCLYQKLMWQLDWLLMDVPVEETPYMRTYRRHGFDAIAGKMRRGCIDMTVDAFIRDHVPEV